MLGITRAMQVPTTAPAAITSGTAQLYVFSTPMRRAVIDVDPDYAGKLKVVWNDSPASATVWNHSKGANSTIYSPEMMSISKVSIYADGADATLGTDFTVYGIHE